MLGHRAEVEAEGVDAAAEREGRRLTDIESIPSPWHNKGWWNPPTHIALHSTAGSLASTLATFGPGSTRRVSAHFTISGFESRIIQHVSLEDRSWATAGANDFAYSIEHVDNGPWGVHPEATYALSAWLVRYIAEQHRLRWGVALPINDDRIGPHSRWTATACPAALDWPRIISEAAGGSMAEYVSRQEFDAYQTDVRASFESVKKALHDHGHGKPTFPLTAIRLPAAPRKRTAVSARAGHGKGKMKGDVK